MVARTSFAETFVVFMLAFGIASPAVAGGGVSVVVQPWGPVKEVTFDPATPPLDDNGKPILSKDEAAKALGVPIADFAYHAVEDGKGGLTLTGLDITVQGSTTVYLPIGADQQLTDHEYGHDVLYKYEYQSSSEIFTDATRELLGKTFQNEAALKQAVNSALDVATSSVELALNLSALKYDYLTNHGLNNQVNPKTGKPVDTPTGIQMTEHEFDDLIPTGEPTRPCGCRPWAGTAPDPARVFFDSVTNRISFGGDVLITDAATSSDPIVGRGKFQVEPLNSDRPYRRRSNSSVGYDIEHCR